MGRTMKNPPIRPALNKTPLYTSLVRTDMAQIETFFDRIESRLHGIQDVTDVTRGARVEEDKYIARGSGPGGNFRQEFIVAMTPAFQTEYDGIGVGVDPTIELERRVEDACLSVRKEFGLEHAKGVFVSEEAADRAVDFDASGQLVVKAYYLPDPE